MAEREEKRGQFTLKGYEITPEFITRVRLAAKARKRTMVAYIVETMTEQAEADLKGSRGEHTPTANAVPARQEDVAGVASVLASLVQRLDDREERQAARDAQLNERLAALEASGTTISTTSGSGTPAGTTTPDPLAASLDRMRRRRGR